MFTSLYVQAFITSGTELYVNALLSQFECMSVCRSCAVSVSKLDACFALCSSAVSTCSFMSVKLLKCPLMHVL